MGLFKIKSLTMQILHRQDQILNHQLKCASCGSDQMQIMCSSPPARWRCRKCKVWVTSEPEEVTPW